MQASRQSVRDDPARLRQMIEYVLAHVRDERARLDNPHTVALYARIEDTLVDVEKELDAHEAWVAWETEPRRSKLVSVERR